MKGHLFVWMVVVVLLLLLSSVFRKSSFNFCSSTYKHGRAGERSNSDSLSLSHIKTHHCNNGISGNHTLLLLQTWQARFLCQIFLIFGTVCHTWILLIDYWEGVPSIFSILVSSVITATLEKGLSLNVLAWRILAERRTLRVWLRKVDPQSQPPFIRWLRETHLNVRTLSLSLHHQMTKRNSPEC